MFIQQMPFAQPLILGFKISPFTEMPFHFFGFSVCFGNSFKMLTGWTEVKVRTATSLWIVGLYIKNNYFSINYLTSQFSKT